MKGLGRVVIGSAVGGLVGAASFFAVDGVMPKAADAQSTLYPSGAGRYGGNSYQDSSGNYYDDDPMYGPKGGLYGGGVLVDDSGQQYDCDTSGYCTPF
ncbi:hypothetical protein [Synechococcus sp. MIT S9509]|uniref:hypothetical protein n=1 Tax=Synechococcus sp. MIT S9509 TaxID=1801630 RepID=UPI00082F34E0|nr:hypothetical protein [Synechococcus sp. MIT S9509]